MIGHINGKVLEVLGEQEIIISTSGGVGYRVTIFNQLGFLLGQEVALFVYTGVRENEISLWGFTHKQELVLFQKLLEVSGVGLRTAHNLVGQLGVDQIVTAIKTANPGALKVPGVGSKIAERITLELKDKLSNMQVGVSDGQSITPEVASQVAEVTEALLNLGYKLGEINKVLVGLDLNEFNDTQAVIKFILTKI